MLLNQKIATLATKIREHPLIKGAVYYGRVQIFP